MLEKDKIIKTDAKTVLNDFFSTITSNLIILKYPVSDSTSNDIRDPVLKYVLKYKYHPSWKVIEKISKLSSLFNIFNLEKGVTLDEIVDLDASKS